MIVLVIILVLVLFFLAPYIIGGSVEVARKVSDYNRDRTENNKTQKNIDVIKSEKLYRIVYDACVLSINNKKEYFLSSDVNPHFSYDLSFRFESTVADCGSLIKYSEYGYDFLSDGGKALALAIAEDLKNKYKDDFDIKIWSLNDTAYSDGGCAYSVYRIYVSFKGKYIKTNKLKKINLE